MRAWLILVARYALVGISFAIMGAVFSSMDVSMPVRYMLSIVTGFILALGVWCVTEEWQ